MTSPVIGVVVLEHGVGLDLPCYETGGAAGMDLRAGLVEDAPLLLEPGAFAAIPTGLCLEIPQGYEGQVRPRSGLAARHGISVLNAPGTIDSDYRGEVKVLLVNHSRETFSVTRAMRIAQLVIAPVVQARLVRVDDLSASGRGSGGFGSTGTN